MVDEGEGADLAEGPMWAKKDGRTNLGEVMNRLRRPIAVVALMLGASAIPLASTPDRTGWMSQVES
jgi:hypothetical protein